MNIIDVIAKKRDKKSLNSKEIDFFVSSAAKGTIPDYQISAMLMAIYINGLDGEETAALTNAMIHSGKILNLNKIDGIKVDKHSTGGVSDATTLIIAPLTASCGYTVVKMSGRALGYTGGTIDKLNSIPGFRTLLMTDEAIETAKKHGVVVTEQTNDLVPADKILYSLRDVTATTESIPLIASSIMSKKIAAGADAIVIDVKCGSGAFMKNLEDAEKLAELAEAIGARFGKKVKAIITDMNTPLGMYIGNSLEIIEAAEILKNKIDGRLKTVSLELAANMISIADENIDYNTAFKMLEENIANGAGFKKFKEFIAAQGGNPNAVEDYSLLPAAAKIGCFKSEKSGFITKIDALSVGRAGIEAGAGRKAKTDSIDYGAGIILKNKIGDYVEKGTVLAEIHCSSEEKYINACNEIKKAFEIH